VIKESGKVWLEVANVRYGSIVRMLSDILERDMSIDHIWKKQSRIRGIPFIVLEKMKVDRKLHQLYSKVRILKIIPVFRGILITWRISNIGTLPFPDNAEFVYVSGTRFPSFKIGPLGVGEQLDIDIIIPTVLLKDRMKYKWKILGVPSDGQILYKHHS